jgi:uncharacterized membrane protein YeaQ/YmgE (transglycosylase-associated protein family)
MIIFAILGLGIIAGGVAGLITGERDWGRRIIAGLVGSFVGGLLGSLLFEDDLDLRPSGIIGSIVGAVIVLLVLHLVDRRS